MPDPILVVIFLRGGADALGLVGPTADPDYLAARPEALRVRRDGDAAGHMLTDALADVDFRLHPAAGELAELFHAGDLSIVHATGLTEATRSHFDAEARMERGAASGGDGWLGRWLAANAPGGPLPALAVGTSMPEALRGARAPSAEALGDLRLPGWGLAPALRSRLATGFGAHDALGATVQDLIALSGVLSGLQFHEDGSLADVGTGDYPDAPLAKALRTVAQAIKSDLGLRIATVDYGGWDTHVAQAGQFDGLVAGLSSGLMAFWRDLGPRQPDVAVIIQTEFGRRLRSNASLGTDHGRAGTMMVLGPQARGGRLLGTWPGLHHDALEEGADLAVTTDYRDVLADVIGGHLGGAAEPVFPGLARRPTGLYA